ncbi:Transcription factor hamlet [Porphyridium purpureum]|uniref:Transcription factor hamlet n=1 Tax=Porphyridium purpureum TaxID=35688 RepID=A0A5J4Z193_PORPP|nr:Transcription factor hamlet [Porphyridium purpureum]|eukprot:POR3248..scf208_2
MAAQVFPSVLNILLADEEINTWLVKWIEPRRDKDEGSFSQQLSEASRDSVASDLSTDFDVQTSFNDPIAPQEKACMPYLPRQEDLDRAIIWDFDMEHQTKLSCAVLIPMSLGSNQSRFLHGVMMLNTTVVPLPKGVSVLPGLRFSAFRTRYGVAYISVSSCTDGSVIVTLKRMWDNFRVKVETFHTPSVKPGAQLLSYTVIERPGLCVQGCTPGSCLCWRAISSRRTEDQLSQKYSWVDFAAAYEELLRAILLENADMKCQTFLGDGSLLFELNLKSKFQVTSGAMYPNIDHVKFLFFDRLTTASSIHHRRTIDWTVMLDSDLAVTKRQRLDSPVDSGFQPEGESDPDTHQCKTCGKVFNRGRDLRRHLKMVHERAERSVCDECGRTFSQRSNLLSHIRVVHEKRRDFECSVCSMTFSLMSNWKRHVRNVHQEVAEE